MKEKNNTLSDLNDMLFKQLERLDSADNFDMLDVEVKRSKEMSNVAKNIVANGRLALDAARQGSSDIDVNKIPKMLE